MGLNNPGGYKGAVKPVVCCPVVNGGFETGDFMGWGVVADGGTIQIASGGAPEGTYFARMTKTGVGEMYLGPLLPPVSCSPYGCRLIFEYRSTCAEWPAASVASITTNTGGGYLRITMLSPAANWTTVTIIIYAYPAADH